ncbi:MAG: helix-turn-helix domain-containing protein [Streptosporangiaceae bacterium]
MARPSAALRERLLVSALQLFVHHGFRGTSLQDIASDVGCAKASLLYHFSNKEAILGEVLAPVVKEVVELDARLSPLDGDTAAVTAVTGFADLASRHRQEIKVLFDTLTEEFHVPDADDEGIKERLVDAFAGRSKEPQARVAALMAIGGIFIASADDAPLDTEILRVTLIRTALRTLDLQPIRLEGTRPCVQP